MSFNFNWPQWEPEFIKQLQQNAQQAMNMPGAKDPSIVGDMIVKDLSLGTVAPELKVESIDELNEHRFAATFHFKYAGNAYIMLNARAEINALKMENAFFMSGGSLFMNQSTVMPLELLITDIKIDGRIKITVDYTLLPPSSSPGPNITTINIVGGVFGAGASASSSSANNNHGHNNNNNTNESSSEEDDDQFFRRRRRRRSKQLTTTKTTTTTTTPNGNAKTTTTTTTTTTAPEQKKTKLTIALLNDPLVSINVISNFEKDLPMTKNLLISMIEGTVRDNIKNVLVKPIEVEF